MHFKRGFIVLVVAGFVAGVSLSGCVLPVKPPVKDNPKPSASVSAGAKTPAELEGAVEIEGAFGDGSMWAKVGPVYRLENGVSALALTAGYSKETSGFPARSSVGSAIATVNVSIQMPYSGIFVLNDTEVFEPLVDKVGSDNVLWVPQDPSLDKERMHPFDEKKQGGLQESVLVPFGDVGKGTKSVGVSVGLIGFAPDVPVADGSKAPKKLQSALKKLPQDTGSLVDVHAPYSEFTKVPGMDVSSTKESLEVSLAADVFFDSGKWDLKPESQSTLDEVAKAVATHEKGEVSIVGHTDNVPDRIVGNQVLSENRANAVKTVLEGKSELAGFTFVASGKGETEPVAPNDTDENKAKNRRVQVSIKTPVKKEILELQAANAEKPPASGQESTWPDPVLYDIDRTGSAPKAVEITASEAIAYKNYTLVTFKVKNINARMLAVGNLMVGGHHRGEIMLAYPGLYGAEILRGQTRTVALEYPRPGVSGTVEHAVIAGGGLHAKPIVNPNDEFSVPVLYPPTSDDTITIDASGKNYATGQPYGWRINDIPVKAPGETNKSGKSTKSGKTNFTEKSRPSQSDRESGKTTTASFNQKS